LVCGEELLGAIENLSLLVVGEEPFLHVWGEGTCLGSAGDGRVDLGGAVP
jgi:hypothetical protein